MPTKIRPLALVGLLCAAQLILPHLSRAQAEDALPAFDQWPQVLTIGGSILLGGTQTGPETLSRALIGRELTGRVVLFCDANVSPEEFVQWASLFHRAQDFHAIRVSDDPDLDQAASLMGDADIVIWRSLDSVGAADLQQLFKIRDSLRSFVSRGGTLAAIGPAAPVLAEKFCDSQGSTDRWRQGLGLVPDTHLRFGDSPDSQRAVQKRLVQYPGDVGITMDKGTIARLSGRILSPHGPGTVSVMIAEDRSEDTTVRKTIREPKRAPRSANDFLVDLTQWRRMSIDQQLPEFPPLQPPVPHVANGTLLIVGGGGMPEGLMEEFIRLAGGNEEARLVYVPCSQETLVPSPQRTVTQWKRMGVKHASMIHTKDRQQAHSDEEFMRPLEDATGIWFGGGRQWNFADSYYGTRTQALMKKVLERGGVIGGSSAGASIQADFLARATPIENRDILAPGYLRGGLGFLQGVAIDQHFTQRRRQGDMTQLMKRYPQMLGIGIDESTALVVRENVATVTGNGDVYFYDRRTESEGDSTDYLRVSSGGQYDLAARRLISPQPTGNEDSSLEGVDSKRGITAP